MSRRYPARLTIGLLSMLTLGACTTVSHSPPLPATTVGTWVLCKVDPALRAPLAKPEDPKSDAKRELEMYSLRQNAIIDKSQERTASAVRSLDDCNDVNTKLAAALAPKRAWWHVW